MTMCGCGSGRAAGACCAPLLAREKQAATAEALMRSRYSAYLQGDVEYLHETLHPEHRDDHDIEATRRWAREAGWEGLEVRSVERGGEGDDEGVVEFVARFHEKGVHRIHHEIARFQRVEGVWYYVDGEFVAPKPRKHDAPKVGRNDPCPCGSGRKYKKCCGR